MTLGDHAGPPSGIEAIAAKVGGLAWVSGQLFAIEGRWAASMADDAAVAHLATSARHHGWHAELWQAALPDSAVLAAGSLVAPPSGGWLRACAAADALDFPETMQGAVDPVVDVQRLAVLYRGLLPRTISMVTHLETMLGGPGDAHFERVCDLVHTDLTRDAQRGQSLLEATLRGQIGIDAANEITKSLDQAFLT